MKKWTNEMKEIVEEYMNENDEFFKFEELFEKALKPNGVKQLTKEEKDYLLNKLEQLKNK